jgi:hypothetical protein
VAGEVDHEVRVLEERREDQHLLDVDGASSIAWARARRCSVAAMTKPCAPG